MNATASLTLRYYKKSNACVAIQLKENLSLCFFNVCTVYKWVYKVQLPWAFVWLTTCQCG